MYDLQARITAGSGEHVYSIPSINNSGQIVARSGTHAVRLDPATIPLTMHPVLSTAIENGAGNGMDGSLRPQTIRPVLKDSTLDATAISGGLVCDGVTPLLIKLEGLIGTSYSLEISVDAMTGSISDAGGIGSHLYGLGNAGWTAAAGGSAILKAPKSASVPDDGERYAYISGIRADSLKLAAGSQEVLCTLVVKELNAANIPWIKAAEAKFKLRKPPVVLVHGYNTLGEWGADFLNIVGQTRPYKDASGNVLPDSFVRVFKYGVDPEERVVLDRSSGEPIRTYTHYSSYVNTTGRLDELAQLVDAKLAQEIEDPAAAWRAQWAMTRYDVIGHSQGGVLARMLTTQSGIHPPMTIPVTVPAFRSESNHYCGRFHRVITIGSPHNGSTLVAYMQALRKEPGFAFAKVVPAVLSSAMLCRYVGADAPILQEKFAPFGEQIIGINTPGSPWTPDPQAKFHLIGTTSPVDNPASRLLRLYITDPVAAYASSNPPVMPYPDYERLHQEANLRRQTVIPLGADGVVDLQSQHGGVLGASNSVVLAGSNHSGPDFLFGAPTHDVEAQVVAYDCMLALNGTAGKFGPFPTAAGAIVLLTNKAKIEEAAKRAAGNGSARGGTMVAVPPGSSSSGTLRALEAGPVTAAAAATYRFQMNAVPEHPLEGTPVWVVQVFNENGITDAGVTMVADPNDATIVNITVDGSVVGDVVLTGSYRSTDGFQVIPDPVLVASNAPAANLIGLHLSPPSVTLKSGVTFDPEVWGLYDNGVMRRFYVPVAERLFLSSDSSVVEVGSEGKLTAKAGGTATVELTCRGQTGSMAVTVGAPPLPVIAQQPVSQTVLEGQSASFSVIADGGGSPVTYQWRRNTVAMPQQTGDTLVVDHAATADAGTYDVVVTNAGGSVTSSSALLTVQNGKPAITVQPAPEAAVQGGTVAFTVEAIGTPPLAYQWMKNGANLTGAPNAATLTLSSVQAANAGSYTVKVTNALGSVVSDAAVLTVGAAGVTGFPSVDGQPEAQLVAVGQTASFAVLTSGNPTLTHQWRKNGTAITGATSTSCVLSPVALTSAATYSVLVKNSVGSVTSAGARLAVVDRKFSAMTINEATILSLSVAAAAPAGTILTYLWRKDGVDLADGTNNGHVTSGATSAKLSITKADATTEGRYSCVVGMVGLSLESGAYDVTVRLKPVVDSAAPFTWAISGSVNNQITAQNNPTSYTFTGLPAGVTGTTTTGQLSGKPNAAATSTKTFTVTTTNAAGTSAPVTFSYTVAGLPAMTVGTFNGLVDRDATLSAPVTTPAGLKLQGHGGRLSNLAVTSTGSFTGTLLLEDKSYTMPIGSRLEAVPGPNPSATVHLVRGTATDSIPDLTLTFAIDRSTGELTGTLSDGAATMPANSVRAWRSAGAVVATPLAGNYTASLELDPSKAGYAAHPDIPQGNGYATLVITTAGAVTWGGKLADGTAITGGTTLGPNGEVPLHLMLYTPTVPTTAGSVHGWARATADSATAPVNSGKPLLDGTVDWRKLRQADASTTRSYKTGFPLHNLTVIGGKYAAPPAGTPVLGLTDGGVGTKNAKLVFAEGDIASSALAGPGSPPGSPTGTLNQAFRISTANAVTMPAFNATLNPNPNPGTVTLTMFTVSSGAIGGNFTLKDNDPTDTVVPITVITRSVPWSGVLVPRLGKGVGQFQLPQLPTLGPPKTTSTTSPQLSGQVLLEAGP